MVEVVIRTTASWGLGARGRRCDSHEGNVISYWVGSRSVTASFHPAGNS